MIRVTIELLPGGLEEGKRTVGLMEIANIGGSLTGECDYAVVLKKCPPFAGALIRNWRAGRFTEGEDFVGSTVEGFHRVRRGVYDLVFRALKACRIEERNR